MEEESMKFYTFYADGIFSPIYASSEETLDQMNTYSNDNGTEICWIMPIYGVWNALVHEAKLGDRQDDEWMKDALERVLQVVKEKKELLKKKK